ncbi:MAG: type I pantothenate kinase [Pseudomonadota bacterium]|nr:type I pantothenate kinase [Pseudomonadota bacterium]MEC8019938.1 type I pantothenate kinase [Pseudomonadota bacterium]MEC8498126.1 type I pantothenate kinase [Pseudomonadota bacterium]MEC8797746.1 type I pantothenate kinase [Pseudomonadota bacterium]|tara:strand:+ start:797 stop:1735 length:939 start_codon:yes stop_codon:yes gene_type:complete
MSRLEENFTKFRYADWLPLSNEDIYQLNEKDFQVINDLQEKFKEDLVDKSYLSMVDLLSINIRNYNRINRKIKDTETSEQKKYPFIIGVAGSVASGKSTFSRILELLLKKSLKGFNIKLLTTDGFLYPNSVLKENNLMEKKGFPESYDIDSFYKFLSSVKAGVSKTYAPIYSHNLYDIIPDEKLEIIDPDVVIIEGINVLQSAKSKDKKTILEVQDFLNFSIYLDADERYLRQWYIDRFLSLRLAALNNKEDFFNRFSSIDIDQAKEIANSIWEKINLINLNENILPTKYKANLILKKNINHKTNEIWLRNI